MGGFMEGLKLWYCSKNLPPRIKAEYIFAPPESERMLNKEVRGLRVVFHKSNFPPHISEIGVYGIKNREFVSGKYRMAGGNDIKNFLEEINQFNFLEMLEKV